MGIKFIHTLPRQHYRTLHTCLPPPPVCVLRGTEAGSTAAVCNAPFTTWREVQAWPGQSLLPVGMWQSTVYCCASGSHLRAPTPQQRMLSMVPSLPSPTQRALGILELSSKLWLCLLWPQHHGTNTHNTAALNSAWLH